MQFFESAVSPWLTQPRIGRYAQNQKPEVRREQRSRESDGVKNWCHSYSDGVHWKHLPFMLEVRWNLWFHDRNQITEALVSMQKRLQMPKA